MERLAAASLVAVVLGGGALAQQAEERAVRAWIDAIDASPDWSAAFRSLYYDAASGATVLSALSVRSRVPGMALSFETVSLVGFEETGDGGFASRRVAATGGTVVAGATSIALADLRFDDVVTSGSDFAWDPTRPFTSLVHAYGLLTTVRTSAGQIGSLTVTENLDDIESRVTYRNVSLGAMDNGRIAAISAGPLRSESPSEPPLITIDVAHVDAADMDVGALLHALDRDRYADGIGDEIWRSAVRSTTYRDIVIAAPGARLTVDTVDVADIRVRQPRRAFGPMLDLTGLGLIGEDSPASADSAIDLASAFSLGHLAVSTLDVDAVGIDRIHLDGFAIDRLSIDGLGALTLDGFDGAVAGEASLKLGRLAVADVGFPGADALSAALRMASLDRDVDYSALTPTLGTVEASGVELDVTGIPRASLESMRLALGDYVGELPTSVALDMTGADIATSMIPERRLRALLDGFGYDRIQADASVAIDWREADNTTVVERLGLAIADIGALSGGAVFNGPTRAQLQTVDSFDPLVEALSLKGGKLTFTDDSIVGRVLASQAERVGVDPDTFRKQFALGLPFMLSFLGDRELQAQIAPELQTFIQRPGSIAVVAAPPAPIALSAIASAVSASPFGLPRLLALTVSSQAGPEPDHGASAAGEPAELSAPADDDTQIRRTLVPAD